MKLSNLIPLRQRVRYPYAACGENQAGDRGESVSWVAPMGVGKTVVPRRLRIMPRMRCLPPASWLDIMPRLVSKNRSSRATRYKRCHLRPRPAVNAYDARTLRRQAERRHTWYMLRAPIKTPWDRALTHPRRTLRGCRQADPTQRSRAMRPTYTWRALLDAFMKTPRSHTPYRNILWVSARWPHPAHPRPWCARHT